MKEMNVDSSKMDKLVIEHTNIRNLWKKRKEHCMDVVEMLMEDIPTKKRKETMESYGIETDEDVNVKIPQLLNQNRR